MQYPAEEGTTEKVLKALRSREPAIRADMRARIREQHLVDAAPALGELARLLTTKNRRIVGTMTEGDIKQELSQTTELRNELMSQQIARWKLIEEALGGVLGRHRSKIPAQSLQFLDSYLGAGEYGLAYEDLVGLKDLPAITFSAEDQFALDEALRLMDGEATAE